MEGKREVYGYKDKQKSRILISYSDTQEFVAVNVLSREGYTKISVKKIN